MKLNLLKQLVSILGVMMIFQNCAPVFSELQSARTVGKDKIEVTPLFSSINYAEDGESNGIQNHLGLRVAYGISPKTDIRLAYEYIWLKDDKDGEGISILGIGPKFSLLENKIAFYMPLGRAVGENTKDTWQLHPTFLFTYPVVEDKVDVTLSPKYLMTFCEGCDDLVAINLGFSFSNNLNKWSIRPEYGLLFNPGEKGHFGHFSLGVSAVIGQ